MNADTMSLFQDRRLAVRVAVVAAVFSLIVVGLLITNYVKRTVSDAERTARLDAMKIVLARAPGNQELITEIRELDLTVRQNMIRRLDYSRKGAWFLLVSLVVLVAGLKWQSSLDKKPPAPQPTVQTSDRQSSLAAWSRRCVGVSVLVFLSAALLLGISPRIDFEQTGPAVSPYPSPEEINRNWPYFRGPGGAGRSAHKNVPTSFDPNTGKGILWKSPVPLLAFNSPVVWEDRVFLSGADVNDRQVYCYDGSSGRLLWTGDVPALPSPSPSEEEIEPMEDTGFAAPTMATDGRRVYAIFATGDIAAFDFNGRRVWARNLGTPENTYGYASSLTMYQSLVLVQYDQATPEDERSKFIALNTFTGRTVWDANRPVGNSWTSPVVVNVADKPQLLTVADPWAIAYNPADGSEIWRADCVGGEVASSPIDANGLVLVIKPYETIVAIKPDGSGDVTKTHIAWNVEADAPDICSPVSDGEFVFLLTTEGVIYCHKVADGALVWEKDLEASFYASPSIVGDYLYLVSSKGVMFVIEIGNEIKELSRSKLDEKSYASPAFVDGRIYIRGDKHLYCITNMD